MNTPEEVPTEKITQLYAELGSVAYNLQNLEKYIKQLKAQKARLLQELNAINNALERVDKK